MEFQSAARFGERRVMVTDYDETELEVNAKVLDEDTGEVICECESGGGGGDSAILTVNASDDMTFPLTTLLYLPVINAETGISTYRQSITLQSAQDSVQLEVLPGPNGAYMYVDEAVDEISGDIEYSQEWLGYIITGNSNLTFGINTSPA